MNRQGTIIYNRTGTLNIADRETRCIKQRANQRTFGRGRILPLVRQQTLDQRTDALRTVDRDRAVVLNNRFALVAHNNHGIGCDRACRLPFGSSIIRQQTAHNEHVIGRQATGIVDRAVVSDQIFIVERTRRSVIDRRVNNGRKTVLNRNRAGIVQSTLPLNVTNCETFGRTDKTSDHFVGQPFTIELSDDSINQVPKCGITCDRDIAGVVNDGFINTFVVLATCCDQRTNAKIRFRGFTFNRVLCIVGQQTTNKEEVISLKGTSSVVCDRTVNAQDVFKRSLTAIIESTID